MKGLYVAAEYGDESQILLANYCEEMGIPEHLEDGDFHTTIVYSRKEIEFPTFKEIDIAVNLSNVTFDVWDTEDGNRALVMKIFSPYLQLRFNEAMHLGATYDYEEYNPHITLSYNIGGWDFTKLVPPNCTVQINKEISEVLDLNAERKYEK